MYFLYNPASFIPAWTPTESILLFNWLLNQFLGLSFLLHHFFQFQHGILEFEMLKTSLYSVMTFGCNIFQLFTTMLLEKRKPPHLSVIQYPFVLKRLSKCKSALCWLYNIIRYAKYAEYLFMNYYTGVLFSIFKTKSVILVFIIFSLS